ncbi:hypothetical protein SK3146_02400 [Paenibacillus konkukensis]|uniref:Uncharacterized protein n=1 Tax=Paenibacillus konkukensis TaxID=2020716 RepID=A0ABY4RNF2_9BACL|nr:hypothetical protein SK3146_02400 [Paenibacillus konkukensis]
MRQDGNRLCAWQAEQHSGYAGAVIGQKSVDRKMYPLYDEGVKYTKPWFCIKNQIGVILLCLKVR